jgi:hypothetical protein
MGLEPFGEDLEEAWGTLVTLAEEMDAETGYASIDLKIKIFDLAVKVCVLTQLEKIAATLEKLSQ